MLKEEGHFVLGISLNGKKFRPSDWIERIATDFASFDCSHRLQYNPKVMPVKHDGQHCLFVASSLAEQEPAAFAFIMNFANSNRLQIKKKNPAHETELTNAIQNAA